MKLSITKKYTLLLTGLLAFTIFCCWFVNRTFLASYYEKSKCDSLVSVNRNISEILSNISTERELTDKENIAIDRITSSNNVSAYILKGKFLEFLQTVFRNDGRSDENYVKAVSDYWIDFYSFNSGDLTKLKYQNKIVSQGKDYVILKVSDSRLDLKYLDLVATIDDDYFLVARTNFDSIETNVSISNKFFAYIGIIVTVLGSVLMYFMARKMTEPIRKLNSVAKSMSNLNFNDRYIGENQDEIGELGASINLLADRLETTISELKSANNELKRDIEKKIQIDEMRKEFLSNVTHELKTPIALIQGYAEGLQDNINEDEESKDFYCDVIIDEANKMNVMVKKLLTLNQIEFGNNLVEFERFDIVQVIRSVIISTDILMKQKKVTLYFEQDEPVYVWADEYMVEEVITNYISNALNHVSGMNLVEIKLIQNENHVRVAVFNTGEQIPEDELDKIWVKFYKVDKARTREYGGSGIGLSIVKAIMNSMNQECGVVNHDTGVEFWFELDKRND